MYEHTIIPDTKCPVPIFNYRTRYCVYVQTATTTACRKSLFGFPEATKQSKSVERA